MKVQREGQVSREFTESLKIAMDTPSDPLNKLPTEPVEDEPPGSPDDKWVIITWVRNEHEWEATDKESVPSKEEGQMAAVERCKQNLLECALGKMRWEVTRV